MSLITKPVFLSSSPHIVFPHISLGLLVNLWRRLRQMIFDSYRPELYYMRGPGPKWREKHAHITSALLDPLSPLVGRTDGLANRT
jgi:hypothetical protein